MTHPLEEKLASVRSRLRRLLALYGLSRVVATAVVAVLVLGLADYCVHFHDRGIRIMAWMAAVGVVLGTVIRLVRGGLAAPLDDLHLARRIERRFPHLNDRLASAVDFVRQSEDDPTAGSVALRRAVIAQGVAECEPLDFHEAVESRSVWRAATLALATTAVALTLVLLDPRSARTAVLRLVNPLNDVAWPQVHHLMVVDPVSRIARGQTFRVTVVDRYGRRLPREVRVTYRFEDPDGAVTEETRLMQFTGRAMVDRRENVTRSFSYRVVGGDDQSMDWMPVEVLEPPAVQSMTATLTPPAYTGWPPATAQGRLRALVGTRVEILARSSSPLQSATLCLEDGTRLPAAVSAGGYQLRFPRPGDPPWIIEHSGGYWLELLDRRGLPSVEGDRWPVQAVPDNPPSVKIETPAANRFVTPQASITVRVAADDDLALKQIQLLFARADTEGGPLQVVPLFAGPERVAPSENGLADAAAARDRQVVDYAWDIAALNLQPGERLTFRASATDYRPQTGRSEPRQLIVITPEALADRIASRQSLILNELARVLELQRQGRSQVAGVEIRLDETGSLDQIEVDRLRGAELTQRQVHRSLTSPQDGLPGHIHGLLADLEDNHLDQPEVVQRMEALLDEIRRLDQQHLTEIGHQLTTAIKAAQVGLDEKLGDEGAADESEEDRTPDPAVAAPLAAAGQHQDAVIAALESLLGQLDRWADYRRFHRELGKLLRQQEELAQRTAEIGRRTLAQDLEDLAPDQLADLRVANRDQLDLARRLDKTFQAMDQAADQLAETDPEAAENVSDALFHGRRTGISAQMQSAGARIAQNRMGQAVRLQREIQENLRELLDILAHRQETQLERLVRKLRQAERDLADLARRQAQLEQEAQAAAAESEADELRRQLEQLRRQQQALEEEARRLARQLERLTAQRASRKTTEAADAMQAASQEAGEGNAGPAARQAQEARRRLEEARRQLTQTRQEAETELAIEQIAQLEDQLMTFRGRQENVIRETQRLDQLGQTQGDWTRGQRATLQELAREEQLLQNQTRATAEKVPGAVVFRLALDQAAQAMGEAAGRLGQQETGAATQQAEQHALARLDQLLAALAQEKPQNQNPAGSNPAGAGNQPGGMSPAQALQALAELKLLKLLQEDVNRRTRQLEEAFGGAENLDGEAQQQYRQLSQEQGRLADLLAQLLEAPDAPPEPAAERPAGPDGELPP